MVFVPCLNTRWVYGHLPLEVCFAKFRFVVHCCSFIMPRSQTRVAQVTTHLVHLASAASLRDGVGETWIAFPKDPEIFAIPRASVWKTKTQAKKFRAKMMAAEEEDKEGDADADEEGDESNDGDGDGGDEGDGPGAGLGATGANRDGGVGEEVEGVEGEKDGGRRGGG